MKRIILCLAVTATMVLASACAVAPILSLPPLIQSHGDGAVAGFSTLGAPRPQGRLAYSRSGAIWILNNGSESQATKPPEGMIDIQPAWSADGTRLAFVRKAESYSDLYVLQLSDMSETGLTHNESGALYRSQPYVQQCNWAFKPAWSPDGTQIAFLSDVYTYDMALWIISSTGEGSHQVSRLQDMVGGLDKPQWAPDGNSIVCASFAGETQQLWSFDLATGKWTQMTTEREAAYDPALAADGNRLAYVVRTQGRHDIWVSDTVTGERFPLTDQGRSRSPVWSPDGEQIAYLSESENSFDIWVATLPAGADKSQVSQYRLTNGLKIDASSGLTWTK